ncbi:MAG: dihydroorotate dehydrogenase [Mycoplasmatales bacterium]
MIDKLSYIKSNMDRLDCKLDNLNFSNIIMPASGCANYGKELSEFYDLNLLGAIIVKSTTNVEYQGNNSHRIFETGNGMLNAIGLQNPGIDTVLKEQLPWLKEQEAKVIVNLAGSDVDSYVEVAKKLEQNKDLLFAIELNVSCPNVKQGGIQFGQDPRVLKELILQILNVTSIPVFVKLSPNVANIQEMAKAVEEAGAFGISMINTLVGMAIDYKTGKPIIDNKIAGYSGNAIKPVALRQIYQVRQVTNLPIIGIGGISSATDVIEFLSVGADLVAIGSANFKNPNICIDVLYDLLQIMDDLNIKHVNEFRGRAHV